MDTRFGSILAQLRHESGMNQRQLAAELNISQALLSHYEKGSREPGLPFVCRVCDHFGISADFLLGRTAAAEKKEDDRGSDLKALSRALFETHNSAARKAAEEYINAAARRTTLRLKFRDGELQIAEESAEMSRAELELLRTLSK